MLKFSCRNGRTLNFTAGTTTTKEVVQEMRRTEMEEYVVKISPASPSQSPNRSLAETLPIRTEFKYSRFINVQTFNININDHNFLDNSRSSSPAIKKTLDSDEMKKIFLRDSFICSIKLASSRQSELQSPSCHGDNQDRLCLRR